MSDVNRTGQTQDISSIVNSAVMAVDAVLRKNAVPAAHRHDELRALLMPVIASMVADHKAELAREELDRVLAATGTTG